MHGVALLTAWNQEILVRNVCAIYQVYSVVPEMKTRLEPFRKKVFVAPVLCAQRTPTKEAGGATEPAATT
jgi:hypothetical protein